MASEYYGLKGDLVKTYQELLNTFGANIKVNGKWGKTTEEAFNQYRDDFLLAIGAKTAENPYSMLSFTPRSEEALAESAKNRYASLYGDQIEAAEVSARDREHSLNKQITSLDTQFQSNLELLSQQYEQARQSLADAALKRGLGRSSYVTDQLASAGKREIADVNALANSTQSQKREIEETIANLKSDTTATKNRLLSEREQRILSAIDEYRQADMEKAQSALQYNNEMLARHNETQTQQAQFTRELANALRVARIRKK